MTIDEAIINAVKEGYHVRVFDGIEMYYSGANTEWSVWTRTDNDSSFMVPVEAIFLDPLFWQAFIGKYLSGLRKLGQVLVLKAGFETQLRTPCLLIPCGMRALGMPRQIRDGRLQGGIQPRDVPGLQCLNQVT
jgi:hypothetical protein